MTNRASFLQKRQKTLKVALIEYKLVDFTNTRNRVREAQGLHVSILLTSNSDAHSHYELGKPIFVCQQEIELKIKKILHLLAIR